MIFEELLGVLAEAFVELGGHGGAEGGGEGAGGEDATVTIFGEGQGDDEIDVGGEGDEIAGAERLHVGGHVHGGEDVGAGEGGAAGEDAVGDSAEREHVGAV